MSRVKEFDPDEALDKAMHTFWLKGYESTSMQDLVDGMGINRFSLYASFGGKRSLYLKALARYYRCITVPRVEALERSEGGLGSIRAFLRDYAFAIRRNARNEDAPKGCLMTMTLGDPIQADPDVARITRANLRRLAQAFRTVLQRGITRQEIRLSADIGAYATFLVGCVQGLDILAKALDRKELDAFIDVAMSKIT